MAEEIFEFIDCATVNIAYQATGLASVSFTVVASSDTLVNDYTTVTFGGVDFKGYIVDYKAPQIEGAHGWEHQISMVAIGC